MLEKDLQTLLPKSLWRRATFTRHGFNLLPEGKSITPPLFPERLGDYVNNVQGDIDLRDLVINTMPCLDVIIKAGLEIKFFGKPVEEYISDSNYLTGIDFRAWMISNLPRRFQQPLEPLEEVNNALDPSDLLNLAKYSPQIKDETYRRKLQHQVASGVALTVLAGIDDQFKNPDNLIALTDFYKDITKLFRQQEGIFLYVHFNSLGQSNRMNILTNKDMKTFDPGDNWENGRVDNYQVRKFGMSSFFILEPREKKPFPRMLKMLRDRPMPLQDVNGIRIILKDKNDVPKFIEHLDKNLTVVDRKTKLLAPKWRFYLDRDLSPETNLKKPIKYFAFPNGSRNIRIEMQMDWLIEDGIRMGSWVPKRYNRGSTYEEYRMRQLLNPNVLPSHFPAEIYGFDWDSLDIQKELLEYAYNKSRE